MANATRKTAILKGLESLKERGPEFIDCYEELCYNHMMVIDTFTGSAVPTVATKREIEMHIEEVRK